MDSITNLYADPLDQYYRYWVSYKVFNSQQEMFYYLKELFRQAKYYYFQTNQIYPLNINDDFITPSFDRPKVNKKAK